MNELFNKKDKPYIIIEGLADYRIGKKSINRKADSKRKKICMYTGSLHEIYKVENLINGFVKANIENAELHVYGDGTTRSN